MELFPVPCICGCVEETGFQPCVHLPKTNVCDRSSSSSSSSSSRVPLVFLLPLHQRLFFLPLRQEVDSVISCTLCRRSDRYQSHSTPLHSGKLPQIAAHHFTSLRIASQLPHWSRSNQRNAPPLSIPIRHPPLTSPTHFHLNSSSNKSRRLPVALELPRPPSHPRQRPASHQTRRGAPPRPADKSRSARRAGP